MRPPANGPLAMPIHGDNCFSVCPDNAIVKLGAGQRYAIDYDFCKGCGICAAECPCGAIDIQPEAI